MKGDDVMILKRCLVVIAAAVLAPLLSAIACSSSPPPPDGGGVDSSAEVGAHDVAAKDRHVTSDVHPKDGGFDAHGRDVRPVDAGVEASSFLTALSVTSAMPDASPIIAMVPPFSATIYDYFVRCPDATNALAVSMTASAGAETFLLQPETTGASPMQTISPLNVAVNQAVVVAVTGPSGTSEYWVRCLPPDFPPVRWNPHPEAGAPTAGYYMLGTFRASGPEAYAMVLDRNGVPVWYRGAPAGVSDVDSVAKGAITFLPLDPTHPGGGQFEVRGLTTSPPPETTLAPNGMPLDFHELQRLPNGDYVVLSSPIQSGVDLTGLPPVPLPDGGSLTGGPGANIIACNIVEFSPTTGTVAWTWSATDHFDPAKDSVESVLAMGPADGGLALGVDTFHCNSIDVDRATGNLLVSARQMNSAFYIEYPSGNVLWKMGGSAASKDGAVYIPVDSPFTGQHDVRLQPGWSICAGGQVSLFDDESYGGGGPARGALYDVLLGPGDGGCDGGTAGATLAWQYPGTGKSPDTGSFRISADGSRVIGWGISSTIAFTEVDVNHDDLLDVELPGGSGTYRAIKVPLSTFDLGVMRMTAGSP